MKQHPASLHARENRQLRERLADGVEVEHAADLVSENEPTIVVGAAANTLLPGLRVPMCAQDCNGLRG